jgi:hypothetical protein
MRLTSLIAGVLPASVLIYCTIISIPKFAQAAVPVRRFAPLKPSAEKKKSLILSMKPNV